MKDASIVPLKLDTNCIFQVFSRLTKSEESGDGCWRANGLQATERGRPEITVNRQVNSSMRNE